jgi:rfaE bifunctional protein kinase chain/domain
MLQPERFFERFKELKIAVVGDVILDKYVFGKVERISPEAPVPVFEIEREEFRAGGAANVALNLKSLGVGEVLLLGRVGKDPEGEILKNLLSSAGVKPFFVNTGGVPTTRKTRLVARSQQLIRIDREKVSPLGEEETRKLLEFLKREKPNAIIVSDYAKGVFTKTLSDGLRDLNITVFVDPRPKNAFLYENFECVTPNLKELKEMALKLGISLEENEFELAQSVRNKLKLSRLVLTLSEKGLALIEPEGIFHVPATAREVYDVTGAGDTVIATLTAFVTAGADWKTACKAANLAAGVVVGKLGTATVTRDELLKELKLLEKKL